MTRQDAFTRNDRGLGVTVGSLLYAGVLAGVLMAPPAARAVPVAVAFEPLASTQLVGEVFSVGIVADIPDPVVGFGLDLSYDAQVLTLVGAPVIGPVWDPVIAPDGDGLAAFAAPEGVVGASILLATVTFLAGSGGTSFLDLGVTAGDLTEGFPLKSGGFAEMDFTAGQVQIVPEPALLGSFLIVVVALGRRRGFAPS